MDYSYAEWRRDNPRGQAPQRGSDLIHVRLPDFFQIAAPIPVQDATRADAPAELCCPLAAAFAFDRPLVLLAVSQGNL